MSIKFLGIFVAVVGVCIYLVSETYFSVSDVEVMGDDSDHQTMAKLGLYTALLGFGTAVVGFIRELLSLMGRRREGK